MLCITKYPFHFNGSEAISETEDKRLNIMTKDAPIANIYFIINYNITLKYNYMFLFFPFFFNKSGVPYTSFCTWNFLLICSGYFIIFYHRLSLHFFFGQCIMFHCVDVP